MRARTEVHGHPTRDPLRCLGVADKPAMDRDLGLPQRLRLLLSDVRVGQRPQGLLPLLPRSLQALRFRKAVQTQA